MNKQILLGVFGLASAGVFAAVPEVSDVVMTQPETGGRVTITYTLANAPAVVTLDIQTNGPNGWVSIGGENIRRFSPSSAVFRKVTTLGQNTITWYASQSWPGHNIPSGGARAVVTAWELTNTPDYMVVDLQPGVVGDPVRYYPNVGCLPGGLLENDTYRTKSLVMRKMSAKGIPWNMGSVSEIGRVNDARETPHQVTLTNNYYIGVFEVTQYQWTMLMGADNDHAAFVYAPDRAMRPYECASYGDIRGGTAAYYWPNAPLSTSFLGRLNDRATGMGFDLPSEAQWEFACRAGNGDGKWGDGSMILNATTDANLPGRYAMNGGKIGGTTAPDPATATAENGTAIVGSYAPNAWGLYDMHGNVWEWCLDWYQASMTEADGKVNVKTDEPAKKLDGSAGANRIKRGGSWAQKAQMCRAAFREDLSPTSRNNENGFRVVCTAGLE